MAADDTGNTPEQEAPTDAAGADETTQQGAPESPTFTQEQVSRIAAKESRAAKAAREEAEAKLAEAQTRLAAFETAEEEKRKAELTAQENLAEAQAALDKTKADLEAERARALRAEIIATEAVDLPPVYRAQVANGDEATIRASIETQREAYQAFQADQRARILADLATADPATIVEKFGEAAAPLAGRLTGTRVNVGAPSAAATTLPPTAEEEARARDELIARADSGDPQAFEELRKQREARRSAGV